MSHKFFILFLLLPTFLFANSTNQESMSNQKLTNVWPTNHQIDIRLPKKPVLFAKPFEIVYSFRDQDRVLAFMGPTVPFDVVSVNVHLKSISNQSMVVSVTPYEVSNFQMPPLRVIALKGHSTNRFLTFEFPIPMHTVASNIKQPAPMAEIFPIFDFLPLIILILILLLSGLVIWWMVKHRRKTEVQTAEEHIDPFEEALSALQSLKKPEDRKVAKPYFVAISEIIRRFIQRMFLFNALEMASSEILRKIKERDTDPDLLEMVQYILRACDWVKYAKHIPSEEQIDLTLKDGLELVKTLQAQKKAEEERQTESQTRRGEDDHEV